MAHQTAMIQDFFRRLWRLSVYLKRERQRRKRKKQQNVKVRGDSKRPPSSKGKSISPFNVKRLSKFETFNAKRKKLKPQRAKVEPEPF